MINQFINDLNNKLDDVCATAEALSEVVSAIRGIPEHKRMVVSLRNSKKARDSLMNLAEVWLDAELPELYDYPIASAIIALSDSDCHKQAIALSRDASCDLSLEIAAGIAGTYLLKKALE